MLKARVVSLVVLFTLFLSLTGCGGGDDTEQYSLAQKTACSVTCSDVEDAEGCESKCLELLDSGDTLETALEHE